MTRIFACMTCLFGVTSLAFAGTPEKADVGADIARVTPCVECHESAGMSLKGEGVDTIVAKIKEIDGGSGDHTPELKGLSEADITEIATLLNQEGGG